jgi:hypothetical protein
MSIDISRAKMQYEMLTSANVWGSGSDMFSTTDIWGGPPPIWSSQVIRNVSRNLTGSSEALFAAALLLDNGPNMGSGDAVDLYLQSQNSPTSHTFSFNPLVNKNYHRAVHVAEFDLNNNCGVDDPPYGDAQSSVSVDIEAGMSNYSNWCALFIGQGLGYLGKKPFRQAITILDSFDTIGLLMRSATSAPDSYIDMIAHDNAAGSSASMLRVLSSGSASENFAIRKNGQTEIRGAGVLKVLTTSSDIAIATTVTPGTTAGAFAIYNAGVAYGRFIISYDGTFGWSSGTTNFDTHLWRGSSGSLATDSDVISAGDIGFKGHHRSYSNSQGITTSTYVFTGASSGEWLTFQDGLLISISY